MSKNIFKNIIVILPLFFAGISAQDQVDAIEAARQAKAAAEKAAADAEAATGAAIEAAAAKAAKEAREKIKQGKLDEEARRAAEKKAAEEAELDAAATAAAEEAKRKMAEELGLEYESPSSSEEVLEEKTVTEEDVSVSEDAEEVVVKDKIGFDLGFTGSVGFINGSYITNTPVGGSLVLKTPYGFNLGESIKAKISLAAGSYNGEGDNEPLEALFIGLGLNATLFQFVFSETHIGVIGAGPGVRVFNGITLEKLLNKGLNLPVNVLVGAEGFLLTKADDNLGNSTYWGGLGLRLDYSF